jgi:hypothetical protein
LLANGSVEWISRMRTWSEFNYICIYYGLSTCDLRLLLTVFVFLDGKLTADGWAVFPPKNYWYSNCNFKFFWEQLPDKLNTENACYILVKRTFVHRLPCKMRVHIGFFIRVLNKISTRRWGKTMNWRFVERKYRGWYWDPLENRQQAVWRDCLGRIFPILCSSPISSSWYEDRCNERNNGPHEAKDGKFVINVGKGVRSYEKGPVWSQSIAEGGYCLRTGSHDWHP